MAAGRIGRRGAVGIRAALLRGRRWEGRRWEDEQHEQRQGEHYEFGHRVKPQRRLNFNWQLEYRLTDVKKIITLWPDFQIIHYQILRGQQGRPPDYQGRSEAPANYQ